MDTLNALLMGIVQGLAEYLPISSSGHLEICHQLLGLDTEGAESLEFDLMLHVATVLSTILVLWREFLPLCRSFFTLRRDDNFYYVCKLLVSAIPVGIIGLCFKDQIEALYGGNLMVVGICLIATAALLSFAYFSRTRQELRTPRGAAGEMGHKISWIDAFVIGIAQAVAVLPGLSRSGSTIATGILLGDRRADLARFSFFMVIIPILGEALLDLLKIAKPAADAVQTASMGVAPMAVGFLAAFIVGCAACKWMIELVKRGKLIWFALYCVVVGTVCILSQTAF